MFISAGDITLYSTSLEMDTFFRGLQQNYALTLDRFVAACVPEQDSDHSFFGSGA